MRRPTIRPCVMALLVVGIATLPALDGAFAQARVTGSNCAAGGPAAPTPSAAAPPADVLTRFSVLARPTTPADQVPLVNSLGLSLAGQLGSYDSAYVRFLATLPGGRQLFVIPGTSAKIPLPPLSCVPAKDRGPLEQAIHEQAKVATGPIYCLAVSGGGTLPFAPSATCVPFALEPNGYAIASVGQNAIGDPSRTLAGLVPDGVSSVQLSFSLAPRLTVTATNNTFVARGKFRYLDTLERRAARAAQHGFAGASKHAAELLAKRSLLLERRVAAAATPTHVRWIGPTGQIVATFAPPSSVPAQQELGTLGSYSVSNGSGQSGFSSGVAFYAAF
jgi:hypothetical protein